MRPRPIRLHRIGVILLGLLIISGCKTEPIPTPGYIRFTDFREYSEYKVKGMTKEYIDYRGKVAMSNKIE